MTPEALQRAHATGPPAGAHRRGAPASIGDIFLARLAELERRVEHELDRAAPSLGPAGELVLDLVRQGWRTVAALAASASGDGRRKALVSWSAARPVDDLGFDPELAAGVREILRPLARRWLGLSENRSAALPEAGGLLLLMNRSAWPLPAEALVLWAWLGDGRCGARQVAAMWDDDLPELPYASDFLRKIGIIAATPANAAALLERGAVVVAFPEGRAAASETYDRRYRLARFELSALFDAAVAAGARVVPGAIVGNEESYALLGRAAGLPLTVQFPLLGLVGLLPLPLSWTLRLGPAIELGAAASGSDAGARLADAARVRMQAMLGELLAERTSAGA